MKEEIFRVPNTDEDVRFTCPHCNEDEVNHWHEIIDINDREIIYMCNFRDEFIGADTSVLNDICKYKDNCKFPHCSGLCAKHNCGAVLRRCIKCGEEYYNPTGCWQMEHNSPSSCLCKEEV